jgi:phage-related holin
MPQKVVTVGEEVLSTHLIYPNHMEEKIRDLFGIIMRGMSFLMALLTIDHIGTCINLNHLKNLSGKSTIITINIKIRYVI